MKKIFFATLLALFFSLPVFAQIDYQPPFDSNVKNFIFQNRIVFPANQEEEVCDDVNWQEVLQIDYYKNASVKNKISKDDLDQLMQIHKNLFCHTPDKKEFATVIWALSVHKDYLIPLLIQTREDLHYYEVTYMTNSPLPFPKNNLLYINYMQRAQSLFSKTPKQFKDLAQIEAYTKRNF